DIEGGVTDQRESLRRAEALGATAETVLGRINLADLVWLHEGPAAGLELKRSAIELAERRGQQGQATWGRAESTWMLYDLGRWDEVLRTNEAVAAFEREHGAGPAGGVLGVQRASL